MPRRVGSLSAFQTGVSGSGEGIGDDLICYYLLTYLTRVKRAPDALVGRPSSKSSNGWRSRTHLARPPQPPPRRGKPCEIIHKLVLTAPGHQADPGLVPQCSPLSQTTCQRSQGEAAAWVPSAHPARPG